MFHFLRGKEYESQTETPEMLIGDVNGITFEQVSSETATAFIELLIIVFYY